MLYEELSLRELKALCRKRDIEPGRTKGEVINQLREADGEELKEDQKYRVIEYTEYVLDGVFHVFFKDDEKRPLTTGYHEELQAETYERAVRAGLNPGGSRHNAWRIRTENGFHTYGIQLR